jgi:hypothetical protein
MRPGVQGGEVEVKKSVLVLVVLSLTVMMAGSLAAQEKRVDPVNWRELVTFLVDLPGYEADKPEGATTSMAEFKMSQASRNYRKGDLGIEIQVLDGGFFPGAYASYKAMENFEIDTSEQLARKVTIQGFPGIETIDYGDKTAMLMLLVGDRFLLTVKGEPLSDSAGLKEIVGRLDLNKLAALGK